jgi:CheY-like chemotaxis protein
VKRILVVDDEPGITEVLQGILSDAGYQVVTASDGRGAISEATALPPDLVLLDFMMPVANGGDVLQTFRSHPDLQRVPVVLMSALDQVGVEGRAQGHAAVLRKPFRSDELRDGVAAHLH